jgi:hypothetical protein
MIFACVYVILKQADPAAAKNDGKKEQKPDFDYSGIISINK